MASTSVVSNSSQNIPIFTGLNYQFWHIKMRTLFMSYDLWELVENGFDDLADVERTTATQWSDLKEKKKRDAKALSLIQQALDDAIFPLVMAATTSKEAWDLLKGEYQGTSKIITVKLQTMCKEFETMLMKQGESVQEFFSKVYSVVN